MLQEKRGTKFRASHVTECDILGCEPSVMYSTSNPNPICILTAKRETGDGERDILYYQVMEYAGHRLHNQQVQRTV